MAETKGITIDFYGNTLEFDKSLDGVNKALKATKQELSTLNKELKLDPSNVDKLNSKFDKLKQQQSLLTEQVKLYENALSQMDSKDIGSKEWQQLTKSLQNARVDLEKVNQTLEKMPHYQVEQLAKKLDEAESKLNKIGGTIENVGKKLTVLSTAVVGLATQGVKYNAQIEQYEVALTNFTGSAEEAKRIIDAIAKDASSSPFSTDNLVQANNLLISTGIEADRSRAIINALGDAIAGSGGGNAELSRMAQNLQQVQNVGKASAMDIRQFAMAGINVYGILADYLGKTTKQVKNMDITFKDLEGAFLNASSEGGIYFGAMSTQSQTLNGQISTLKDTINTLLGDLTAELMPILKDVIDKVNEIVKKIKELSPQQKKVIENIAKIIVVIGPLLTILGRIIGEHGLGGIIGKIGEFISKNEPVKAFLGQFMTSGNKLSIILSSLKYVITNLLKPINLLITAFVLMYVKNEVFRNAVKNLVKALANTLKPILEVIIGVINKVIEILDNVVTTIIQAVTPAFTRIVSIVTSVVNSFRAIINTILNALKPAFNVIVDTINLLIKVFGNTVTSIVKSLNPAFDTISNVVKTVMDVISNLVSSLANSLSPILKSVASFIGTVFVDEFKVAMAIIRGVADVAGGVLKLALDVVINIVKILVAGIKDLVTWLQNLYNKFANTTFGSGFINAIKSITDFIGGLIDKVSSAFSWIDSLIRKLDDTTYSAKQASAAVRNVNTQNRQVVTDVGGSALIRSGGIGVEATIHVNNYGQPIDENQVRSWGSLISEQVNLELGRAL